MKIKMVLLLAALTVSSSLLCADDKAPQHPSKGGQKDAWREKWEKMTPEQREAQKKEWESRRGGDAQPGGEGRPGERMREMAKQLGLDPQAMQNLSREERQAKFKEAVAKKTAELKQKKEAGTLTEEDKKLAARLEEGKRRMEGRGPGENRPGDPRDARKPESKEKE